MGQTFVGIEETGGNRYEIYRSSSRAAALEFLRQQEIKEERRYVVVETPEGNFAKDLIAIFDETRSMTDAVSSAIVNSLMNTFRSISFSSVNSDIDVIV